MPSVYEILHEVANSVMGQFNLGPIPFVGVNIQHTYHHDSDGISDIISNERWMSRVLLQCQPNDVFSTSHTFSNVVSTFPETQIINNNHTRTDMVHGVGSYRNIAPLWVGNNVGVPWNFSEVLSIVINLFQSPHYNWGGFLVQVQLPQNPDAVRSIREIISLFCVELGRSPSSLITTAMFYEICLWNPDMLRYAADFYPMAKDGAVSNFRQIYNNGGFNIPAINSYLYDNTNGNNVLDARRMLCLEETLTIDWYNTLSPLNPLPESNISLTGNYTGTQITPNQALDLRAELYELGMRVYGFPLAGLEEVNDVNIAWINSYFGKYTLEALDNILNLRISDLQLKDLEILQGIFIDQNYNNISDLLIKVSSSKEQKVLVLLNLLNKHAAGIIFERNEDNSIQAKYLDPENKPMPAQLEQIFRNHNLNVHRLIVWQQEYANCGPEVIENFILYLTGKRVSQERAIELHSKLVENALLGIESSNVHLLFEGSAEDHFKTKNYLEQNQDYNNLFHNFDYDNHQHVETIGESHALESLTQGYHP